MTDTQCIVDPSVVCNGPDEGQKLFECAAHGILKTARWRHKCMNDAEWLEAWNEGRGPGHRTLYAANKRTAEYSTEGERIAAIEQFVEEVCQERDCKAYEGSHFQGTPIDICAYAGCKKSGRQDIRKMTKGCPMGRWHLVASLQRPLPPA